MPDRPSSTPSWLQPSPQHQGLKRYLETLRERLWIVVACVALFTGVAVAYVVLADSVYEAEANLLVTPVPTTSEALSSLGLLRESNDPAREVDTATQLVTTTAVAERVPDEVADGRTPSELLDDVEAQPVAESNIVAVTAKDSSATGASELANAFAEAAIEHRTEIIHDRIDQVLPDLRDQLESLPPGSLATEQVASQVATLETLRVSPDPTLSLETPATPPDSPTSPKKLLTIVGGLIAGLVVGTLIAFAMRVLDPRVRREEQLGEIFQLPILARIPKEAARSHQPLVRERLSALTIEAYRTLRSTLIAGRPGSGPTTILITGPSAGGGKTTTAINLATAIAAGGNSVILIEADVRRPSIAKALDLEADAGLISVLLEESSLEDALVADDRYPGLELLLADVTGPSVAELISLPMTRKLVDRAAMRADFVIIDSPPLTEVIDALPLAAHVDEVVMVVRLGQSVLRQTEELGQLLASAGVTPAGVAVVGVERRRRHYYYATDDPSASARRIVRRASAPAGGRNRGERAPVAGQRVGDDR